MCKLTYFLAHKGKHVDVFLPLLIQFNIRQRTDFCGRHQADAAADG